MKSQIKEQENSDEENGVPDDDNLENIDDSDLEELDDNSMKEKKIMAQTKMSSAPCPHAEPGTAGQR